MVEEYRTDDAEIIMITMGSLAGTLKDFVDRKREEGVKVGAAKITVYRPFPIEEIRALAKKAKVLAILEKDVSFGSGGAVFADVARSLINEKEKPIVLDFIIGLGGRDVTFEQLDEALSIAEKAMKEGVEKDIYWIGLREEIL